MVIEHAAFAQDPEEAARQVWTASGKKLAPNGAVMRTAITGAVAGFSDGPEEVEKATLGFCRATHADPRCQASCLVVAECVRQLLLLLLHPTKTTDVEPQYSTPKPSGAAELPDPDPNGSSTQTLPTSSSLPAASTLTPELVEDIIRSAASRAEKILSALEEQDASASFSLQATHEDFREHLFGAQGGSSSSSARSPTLSELRLDDSASIGFTYKCMGAGIWALRRAAGIPAKAAEAAAVAALNVAPPSHPPPAAAEPAADPMSSPESGALGGSDNTGGSSVGGPDPASSKAAQVLLQCERAEVASILEMVARAGGDADTNGAVAGALVGCALGFSRLPQDWVAELPYVAWLEAWTQKLLWAHQLPTVMDTSSGYPKRD